MTTPSEPIPQFDPPPAPEQAWVPKVYTTVPGFVRHNFDFAADETAMVQKKGRVWQKITWRKYYDTVRQLSLGLISLGLEHGDTVCVIGNNAPEWFWSEFAVQAAGGIAACIPSSTTSADLKVIAGQCQPKFAIVQDQLQITKLQSIKDDIPSLKKIIYWEGEGLKNAKDSLLLAFDDALKLGVDFEKKNPNVFEQNIDGGAGGDIAAVCYDLTAKQSPKGIVLTQKALVSSGQGLLLRFPIRANANLIANFPPDSVESRCFCIMPHILTGAILNFPQNADAITADMRVIRPNFVVFSPKQWENTAAEMQAKIKSNPFLPLGYILADIRIKNKKRNFLLGLLNLPGSILFFRPLRSRFGLSRVRCAASTGPAANPEAFRLLQAVGIDLRPVMVIAEAGLIAGQGKEEIDFVAVGRPTANTEVRISANGELLVRGDGLFSGYQGDPQKTAAVLVDGWFHTGISADIDGKGQLVISKK
jgi:long-chain acyl-CoA synthetase